MPTAAVKASEREVILNQDRVANFGMGLKSAAPGTYFLCLCPAGEACYPQGASLLA